MNSFGHPVILKSVRMTWIDLTNIALCCAFPWLHGSGWQHSTHWLLASIYPGHNLLQFQPLRFQELHIVSLWLGEYVISVPARSNTYTTSIDYSIYKNTCNECMCVCVCARVHVCMSVLYVWRSLWISLNVNIYPYVYVHAYITKLNTDKHTHTHKRTHTEIMPPTLNTNALEAFMGLTSALCRSCRSKNLTNHCWMTICAIQTPHQCQHADASWLTSVSFWGLAKDRVCAIGFVKLGYHSRKLTREVKVHVLLPGDLKDWRHPQTSPDPSEHWWRRKWIWLLRWWNEV